MSENEIIASASIWKLMKWACQINSWDIPEVFGGGTWGWKGKDHERMTMIHKDIKSRIPERLINYYSNTRRSHDPLTTQEWCDWRAVDEGIADRCTIRRHRKSRIRSLEKDGCILDDERKARYMKTGNL